MEDLGGRVATSNWQSVGIAAVRDGALASLPPCERERLAPDHSSSWTMSDCFEQGTSSLLEGVAPAMTEKRNHSSKFAILVWRIRK